MNRATPQQKKAIELEFGQSTLLEAGAGSGKTFVVVEKMLSLYEKHLRLRPGERVSESPFVAITFTEKAAHDLRERFKKRLKERSIELEDSRDPLCAQVLEASESDSWLFVSTIHGFCRRLIWEHLPELQLGPQTQIVDERRSRLLKEEVLEGLFRSGQKEELFQKNSSFRLLEVSNEVFKSEIRNRAGLALDQDVQMGWERFQKSYKDYFRTSLGNLLLQERLFLEESFSRLDPSKSVHKVVEFLLEGVKLAEEASFDAVLSYANRYSGKVRLSVPKKEGLEQEIGLRVKEIWDQFKNQIKFFQIVPEFEKELLTDEALLIAYVHSYLKSYQKLKEARELLDYEDLEFKALELLRQKDLREELNSISPVYFVDEFQDTSSIQFKIIKNLSGENLEKLFAVGDAKQSIYSFRGGDVSVYNEFRKKASRRLPLTVNFRSTPQILGFVNETFQNLFYSEGEDYPEYETPMQVLEPFQGTESPENSLAVKEFETGEEPRALLESVQELIQKEGYHPRDIAVLFRKLKGGEIYRSTLEDAGVPVSSSYHEDLYEDGDVLFLEALWGFFQYPTSPYFSYRLREHPRGQKLGYSSDLMSDLWRVYEGAFSKDPRGVFPFFQVVTWIELKTDLFSLSAKIWLKNLLSALESGQGVEAVSREFNRLRQDPFYRERTYPSSDSSDCIRFLTVHSSKGLEFPVVILAGLTQRQSSSKSGIKIQGEWVGIKGWDAQSAEMKDGFQYRIAREIEKAKNDAESKRLLYVALTRAQKKLLLLVPEESRGNWSNWVRNGMNQCGIS